MDAAIIPLKALARESGEPIGWPDKGHLVSLIRHVWK